MGQSSKHGAICYEIEASFGVDTTTFASLRWPVVGMVDASGLKHNKMASEYVTQRRQEGFTYVLGTFRDSTFKTKFWLPGHGAATSGATSAGGLETLLGYILGNVTAIGTGTTFTGGTAAAPTTTSASGFTAGGLIRGGELGDGRGNGQFGAFSAHGSSTLTMLTALPGAPSNGDVCYSSVVVYPSEAPTTTSIQSLRCLLQTANLQYECHGVVPIGFTIGGLTPGVRPFVETTFAVAWWRHSTATFPSATATEQSQPAANAAGSLFVADVGTATRSTRTARDLSISYTLGVELLPGPGGVSAYQDIVGAVRTVDEIAVEWTEDAPAATTTPTPYVDGTTATNKHILATLNPTATKAMGLYMPNVCLDSAPVQFSDNGINRLRCTGKAHTGTTTTTDLTASALRIAFA